jgi:antitoxin HicB
MIKDLDYYMNLTWSYRFEWSNEDNCYIASIAELKGCVADGETIEEATKMLKSAMKSYLSACLDAGFEISEPLKPSKFKGNITYRTKPEKHYRLSIRANLEGISINQLIEKATDLILKTA